MTSSLQYKVCQKYIKYYQQSISRQRHISHSTHMFSDLIQYFWQCSWTQKISIFKRFIVQLVVLSAIGFVLFWSIFVFTWLVGYIVGIQPYYYASTPNFHVRELMPSSLIYVYVNKNMKEQACSYGSQSTFFSELTVPYHQYCNIDQQKLPQMRQQTDIWISKLDTSATQYITGCIKYKHNQISCQKYPANDQLTLFRNLQLQRIYYLQLELHLRKQVKNIGYLPIVQFQQNCWRITKFIKDYYSVFSFVFCCWLTGMLMLCAITYRIYRIIQIYYNNCNKSSIKKHKSSNNIHGNIQNKVSVIKQGAQKQSEPTGRTMQVNMSMLSNGANKINHQQKFIKNPIESIRKQPSNTNSVTNSRAQRDKSNEKIKKVQ